MLGGNLDDSDVSKRSLPEDVINGDTQGKRRRNGKGRAHSTTEYASPLNTFPIRLSHEDYTIAWICALPLELTAARAMLDEEHTMLPVPASDHNVYTLGSISKHNIVIACLPAGVYGLTSATAVGLSLKATFPNAANMPLLVGIGGGVPSEEHDIRLGDVVVSLPTSEYPAVKQYDYGKTTGNGILECKGNLNKPVHGLLNAVASLRAQHDLYSTQIPTNISMALERCSLLQHRYPEVAEDVLFEPGCEHVLDTSICRVCGPLKEVTRPLRQSAAPVMHYGTIASGNQVIKHARTRDRLARQHKILCFEMEAAGLMDFLPCLVIRGISDYCDGHKNKQFQGHAALAAAAYTKELLSMIPIKQSIDLPKVFSQSTPEMSIHDNDQSLEHCKSIMEALTFEEADARRDTVKNAHSQTCKWILDQPKYNQWLDPSQYSDHHGLLWIKGKPATGKSTIMKYILEHTEKQRTDHLIISFFFNARGTDLEKSTLGMYRSLLFQLLSQAKDLQSLLHDVKPCITFGEGDLNLVVRLFKKALEQLKSRHLFCFVDALDECPETQIRQMLETFVQTEDAHFLVCFSSRHYPNISVDSKVELVLEDQDGHSQDLTKYIDSELKIGKHKKAELLKEAIFQKANGIFLWVVLVIRILKREKDRGRVHDMERRLDEIPIGLDDLFRDIILRDAQNLPELILCIQWILYAHRPLRRAEFYYALLSGNSQIALQSWDREEITTTIMDNYILDCSKGLAELTRSKKPIVQFIHESVREFLLKTDTLVELYIGFQDLIEGTSHQKLKECCYRWFTAPIARDMISSCSLSPLPLVSNASTKTFQEKLNATFPFLGYAIQFILFHSDRAQRSEIQQLDFLNGFKWPSWQNIFNMLQRLRRHRLEYQADLNCFSFCLAGLDAINLLRVWWSQWPSDGSFVELIKVLFPRLDHKSFSTLYKAKFKSVKTINDVHMEQINALFALLEQVADYTSGYRKTSLKEPILRVISHWHNDVPIADVQTALREAACRKHAASMQLLLDCCIEFSKAELASILCLVSDPPPALLNKAGSGAIVDGLADTLATRQRLTIDTMRCLSMIQDHANIMLASGNDMPKHQPLVRAVSWADPAVIQLLLDEQPSLNPKVLGEALRVALQGQDSQSLTVAKLLLQAGANVDAQSESGMTALHIATARGSEAAVKLILSEHPNIDLPNSSGATALHCACYQSHRGIIELLLEHGTRVNMTTTAGESPLHAISKATTRDSLLIMDKLIMRGSEVDARDENGDTPLHMVARTPRTPNLEEAILLLLSYGAKIDSRNHRQQTPMHCATSANAPNVLKVILEKGAQINDRDIDGNTPLHLAAMKSGSRHLILILLSYGAEINSRNKLDQTPLHCAAAMRHIDCIGVLIEMGAFTMATDNHGNTPLHTLSTPGLSHGMLDWTAQYAVNLLVQGGSDLEAKDNDGRTPLHLALHCLYHNGTGSDLVGKAIFECGGNIELGQQTVESDGEWKWMCDSIRLVKSTGHWQLAPMVSYQKKDYQIQLMLLEQQNKKRLLMARQVQDQVGPIVK